MCCFREFLNGLILEIELLGPLLEDFLAGRCTHRMFLYTYVSGRYKKSLDIIPVLKVGFQMCYRHGIIYVVFLVSACFY